MPHNDDDMIMFADEVEPQPARNETRKVKPWKLAVVDDDQSIHDVTRLALEGFEFDGRPLEFIHCYSGAEAIEAVKTHPDIAVMLLDVVMETEHAGLDVAKRVREELNNTTIRIILRTGQPGQAPERKVITQYDINDYKEKTELTAQKLFTLMCASLRSYRDIITIVANKQGLERVIRSSAGIFELQSLQDFAAGVLEQLTALLRVDPAAVYVHFNGLAASCHGDAVNIVAGTGIFEGLVGEQADNCLPKDVLEELSEVMTTRQSKMVDDRFIGYFESKTGASNILYISGIGTLDKIDRQLIELFNANVSIAFENVYLHQDIEETQREIVYMLGDAVETRSQETGNHVKRVAELSKFLALEYGLSAEEAELLKLASPLHDVGKIGIPDAILNKPGKLEPDEWEIMQTHAELGAKMLRGSKRKILQAAAIIAGEHHEKWDGSGYPVGKSGEDIHIYGRITALADVFDALSSDRCYKKAWPLADIVKLLEKERGTHFDPKLVDIMLENMPIATSIRDRFRDDFSGSSEAA